MLAASGGDPYFDEHRARFAHDLELVRQHAGGGRVLEVGTYPGYVTYCLKRLGYDAVGVDLDPGRSEAFSRAHGLEVIRCDIEREPLPLADAQFTVVLLCEVFEHLRVDPIHALEEVRRVLAPGGVLVLETPNLYSLGNVARFVTGRGVFPSAWREFSKLRGAGHMGHIREYSAVELREFLDRCGFQVAEARRVVHRASRTGLATDLAYRMLPAVRPFQLFIARRPHE